MNPTEALEDVLRDSAKRTLEAYIKEVESSLLKLHDAMDRRAPDRLFKDKLVYWMSLYQDAKNAELEWRRLAHPEVVRKCEELLSRFHDNCDALQARAFRYVAELDEEIPEEEDAVDSVNLRDHVLPHPLDELHRPLVKEEKSSYPDDYIDEFEKQVSHLQSEFMKLEASLKARKSLRTDPSAVSTPVKSGKLRATAPPFVPANDQPKVYDPSAIATDSRSVDVRPKVKVENSESQDESSDVVQVLSKLTDYIDATRQRDQLPRLEPKCFSGDLLEFPVWLTTFVTMVEKKVPDPCERLLRLGKYVKEPALSVIHKYLCQIDNPQAYEQAKAALVKRYGSKFKLAEEYRARLRRWPVIGDQDYPALQDFSDFLWQCYAAMDTIAYLKVLEDPAQNVLMAEKLPTHLRRRWNRNVVERTEAATITMSDYSAAPYPSFSEFCAFVEKEAKIANGPLMSKRVDSKNNVVHDKDLKSNERKVARSLNVGKSVEPPKGTKSAGAPKAERDKGPPTPSKCDYCSDTKHVIENCTNFNQLSLEDKKSFAKSHNLCFSCLRTDHSFLFCRKQFKQQGKEPLLPKIPPAPLVNILSQATQSTSKVSDTPATGNPEPTKGKESVLSSHDTAALFDSPSIRTLYSHDVLTNGNVKPRPDSAYFSMVTPVLVTHRDTPNVVVRCYAMLDSQSDSCFATTQLLDNFKVSRSRVEVDLKTLNNECRINSTETQGLLVMSLEEDAAPMPLPEVYEKDAIPCNRGSIPDPEEVRKWPHLADIAPHVHPYEAELEVGLLLGYDFAEGSYPDITVKNGRWRPYATKTPLGWVVSGRKGEAERAPDPCPHFCHNISAKPVTFDQLKRGFDMDFVNGSLLEDKISHDDICFDKLMSKEGRIDEEGHVELPLPLRPSTQPIPGAESKDKAYRRFLSTKRRMFRDDDYCKRYVNFMGKMLTEKHFEEAPPLDPDDTRYFYLSHHGVNHPRKLELRVVFDGSMEVMGISLNGMLMTGPDLCNNLVGILLRFRADVIAFMCDIKGMFLQVRVCIRDRNMLRFFWFRNNDPNDEIIEYRLCVHLFGATSSPSCAAYALRMVADLYESKYGSEVANFLREQFYVDDGLKANPDVDSAITLMHASRSMCKDGGFELTKFSSNSAQVVEALPAELRSKELQGWTRGQPLPVQYTLGLALDLQKDAFLFDPDLDKVCSTRRDMLSALSSIYDPLGLIGPILLRGRQLLQALCKQKFKWDEIISDDFLKLWNKWYQDLKALKDLFIPRCYKKGIVRYDKVELHIYVDASKDGYGAAAYLVLVDLLEAIRACSLVMSKVRVAPLKAVPIPRMELQAAVVGVKMKEFLVHHLPYDDITVYLHSDSKIVLAYIANLLLRLHLYVANRVQFIHDRTEVKQWHYVPTEQNPADLASRGCLAHELLGNSLWWEGPQQLREESVVTTAEKYDIPNDDPEIKKEAIVMSQIMEFNILEHYKKVSTWRKLLKSVMIWRRYLKIVWATAKKITVDKTLSYSLREKENAIAYLVQLVQKQSFPREYYKLLAMRYPSDTDREAYKARKAMKSKHNVQKLDVFMAQDDVIRVGGRVKRSNLPSTIKFPILLPKDSFLTVMLINHCHALTGHQSRYLTMNQIRASGWWIPNLRSTVDKVIDPCVICRKLRRAPETQKMADLPMDRLEETAPFTFCGVDFCGPFYIKIKRSTHKRWICLFTCLVIRAVHLEICHEMTTDSFLLAYRRFSSRRGPISTIRCDRGTNLVGAQTALEQELRKMNQKKITDRMLEDDCEWIQFTFNPPKASHMGGVWERMIRSIRNCLEGMLITLGQQLDDESLLTLTHEAEAIVNGRPLSYIDTKDPASVLPLTPSDLLTMKKKGVKVPPGVFEDEDVYAQKRWRRVQYMANVFWSKWRRDYIPLLQERRKWFQGKPNLRVHDIVLLVEDNQPRSAWPLARVIQTKVSQDGFVRSLTVKTKDGEYLRPIHKVVLLFRPKS